MSERNESFNLEWWKNHMGSTPTENLLTKLAKEELLSKENELTKQSPAPTAKSNPCATNDFAACMQRHCDCWYEEGCPTNEQIQQRLLTKLAPPPPKKQEPWIGVDLDGTLAHYDGWVGVHHIGEPVPAMQARVKAWLAEGKHVKIFTARVFDPAPEVQRPIEAWCRKHLGRVLPITCVKDMAMTELWDDRAIQVNINTGQRADGKD